MGKMNLTEAMQSKRPGEWTSEEVSHLQHSFRRTHFDHFQGIQLKKQRKRTIKGVLHVWHLGAWRPESEVNG